MLGCSVLKSSCSQSLDSKWKPVVSHDTLSFPMVLKSGSQDSTISDLITCSTMEQWHSMQALLLCQAGCSKVGRKRQWSVHLTGTNAWTTGSTKSFLLRTATTSGEQLLLSNVHTIPVSTPYTSVCNGSKVRTEWMLHFFTIWRWFYNPKLHHHITIMLKHNFESYATRQPAFTS